MLGKEIQELVRMLEKKTGAYKRHFFNFAIAYGGRNELLDAARTIAHNVKEKRLDPEGINEELIERHLYTAHLPNSSPDLVIRTSGETRLSNFLTWQCAYSELFFMKVCWPAFRKLDLLRAIHSYQKRQRRLGS